MHVKVTNGQIDQFPYTVGHLRRDNPNTSFPKNITAQTLESWGVFKVTTKDQPTYDIKTQKVTKQENPVLENSEWVLNWDIVEKSSEEISEYSEMMAVYNRSLRDEKLIKTDFYALSDVTMSDEIATYRQALRDITTHANWPHLEDADWPTKP